MPVDNVADAPRPTGPVKLPTKPLDTDKFLALFLKQIQTQNPLKPLSNGEMMQQMAQLTSLTSSQQLESSIKDLKVSMGKSQVFTATQSIGKQVRVIAPESPMAAGGKGMDGSVLVVKGADEITVTIKDKDDKEIKKIKLDATTRGGVLDFHWDGIGADGKTPMPEGIYKMSVQASNKGEPVDAYTAGTYTVKSVAFNPKTGGVFLNVDGNLGGIEMDDILKIL